MTTKEQLVDQHIREYESRLRHLNELVVRAKLAAEALEEDHEVRSDLVKYQDEHSELVKEGANLRKMPLAHWREETIKSAGPMAVFDIIAQKLEDLIERAEKK